MSFPFESSGQIDILSEQIDGKPVKKQVIHDFLTKKLESKPDFEHNEREFSYTETETFLKIPYSIRLKIFRNHSDFKVIYNIDNERLTKITLGAIILLAFVSFYSVTAYLVTAGVFGAFFFLLNTFFITSSVSKQLNLMLGNSALDFAGGEQLSPEQKKWVANPQLCPACGTGISDLDLNCPECGLRVKRSHFARPIDLSRYNNASITFEYKKK